jgi:hypothetical protein
MPVQTSQIMQSRASSTASKKAAVFKCASPMSCMYSAVLQLSALPGLRPFIELCSILLSSPISYLCPSPDLCSHSKAVCYCRSGSYTREYIKYLSEMTSGRPVAGFLLHRYLLYCTGTG